MSYYQKILNETIDDLKRNGITYDTINEYDMDLISFLLDYDVYDEFVAMGKFSDSYENFFNLIQEDVDNYVDFDDNDFKEMLTDAIKRNGYDKFAKLITTNGWNPIDKSIMPTDEESFYAKCETDADFYNDVCIDLHNSVMYDWPYLGISIFEGDGMGDFFKDVEYKMD